MNRYLYALTLAASVMMLPGCSNETGEVLDGQADCPVFIPGDSDVEIFLGSTTQGGISVGKRAALEGNADLDSMGVFCLAREKQNINEGAYDIEWFPYGSENWSGCIMKNVKAVKTGSNVAWANPDEHYYYPISQFYCYDFFGYYPYQHENRVNMAENRVVVTYNLDGTTDVIWGRATSEEKYAYSAAYFRQPGNEDRFPSLDLKHVMTRLKFQVMPGAQVEGGYEVAPAMADFAVATVKLVNVAATAELTVADFNRMASLDETNCLSGYGMKDYTLMDADGTPMDTTMVGMDMEVATPLGESVMAVPASEYVVRVHLVNVKTGDVFVTEHPLKLTNSSMFRPGYTYTVTITAHEPKEIQLQANLNGWIDAEDTPSVDL